MSKRVTINVSKLNNVEFTKKEQWRKEIPAMQVSFFKALLSLNLLMHLV
jgi:hypothetical protein